MSSAKVPGNKSAKKPFKIAFTYNLKPEDISKDDPDSEFYAEFDTAHTIDGIKNAIEANGYEVIMIEANESAFDKFRQHRAEIGLVFNFSEAVSTGLDREAHIPAMMEILKLPYTGPAPLAAALILDKARAKEVWSYHGVPNAAFQLFRSKDEPLKAGMSFPLIVKPACEGSSTGIRNSSVVKDEKELRLRIDEVLREFEPPALVEKFLPGREFTVSLIGNGDKLESLPLVEVNFESFPKGVNRIDSYEAKWVWDDPSNPIDAVICPAKVAPELGRNVVDVAKRAFLAIGCRDWARVDVRLDETGEPHVIEINCPVGLLPDPKENSRMPTAARAAGIDFNQLLGKIISAALERYGK